MAARVDVNVLIAVLHRRHRHCARATDWLVMQTDPGAVAICRVVQMGTLRILTTSAAMREDVLSPTRFWHGWDRMTNDDRFSLVAEPPTIELTWREMAEALPTGAAADTDLVPKPTLDRFSFFPSSS